MSDKAHLLQLLAQNEIDQVLALLRAGALAETTLLEAQWQSLNADKRAGILTQEQADVGEARIRRSLLELIERQGQPPAPAATPRAPRQLVVPQDPIQLTAEYVGTTGYQLLSAELSDQNPENYLLSVRLRCIRPPYGQNVSEATVHILHGEAEQAPFQVIFPFVEAQSTAEGVLDFEVPKDWPDAELVIYHGAVEPIKKAKIPLKF